MISIAEKFAIAQKRYQPYINLSDEILSIAELSSDDIILEIKKAEIKSLYFRTSKIELDAQFADDMQKLVKVGVKEVFLFCDSSSNLATEQLNSFLAQYKIYINFKIAQVSSEDIANIRSDKIGKSNLLGFDGEFIENKYQLAYSNGIIISLLNDEASDGIILSNHAERRAFIAKKHTFELSEPEYITSSAQETIKPRVKEIIKTKKKNANLEVVKNIDLNLSLDKETEEENELDLDKSQEDNKFTQEEAISRAAKLDRMFFKEGHLVSIPGSLDDPFNLINQIFNSDNKIKFISNKALELIVKNHYMFKSGIDTSNLPIGLAIKKEILFATTQRVNSMPINELTIKPNPITTEISDPLKYSWLKFASKATISLNDVYGSDIAPRITGIEVHPAITHHKTDDIMLDIPFNYNKRKYNLSIYTSMPVYTENWSYLSHNEHFFGLGFYKLTEADRDRLKSLEDNLNQRGLLDIFIAIVKTSYIDDGGFLFEDRAAVFLEKLFEDILPLTKPKKLEFFIKVLEEQAFEINTFLEDVFEGLDGLYKRLELFSLNLKNQDLAFIEDSAVKIIRTELKTSNNFKIIISRMVGIFELITNNGGNIKEQIEYLLNNENLLTNTLHYVKAKENGMNIIHQRDDLDGKHFSCKFEDEKELTSNLVQASDPAAIIKSLRYLSAIAPHQRASIDTYTQYFSLLSNRDLSSNRGNCYGNIDKQDSALKTIDYYSSDKIAYQYSIGYSLDELEGYDLRTRFLILVEENNDYSIYQGSVYGYNYKKLDKSQVSLPESLESKIELWKKEGKTIGTIGFFDSEIENTIFIEGKEKAHENAMTLLISPNNMSQTKENLENAIKKSVSNYCYAPIGVVKDNLNLVAGFTQIQAISNTKLLALNILSSSGKHYDKQYPDQEFGAYLSLFQFMLTSIRMESDVRVGKKEYQVIEDYNYNLVRLTEATIPDPIKDPGVAAEEKKYEHIINQFCNIYKQNPEFNFAQVVALGLVDYYLDSNLKQQTIKNAKELLQYNGYLTQALRILLSTNVTVEFSIAELKERAHLIASIINKLTSRISYAGRSVKLHALLTQNGNNPENLVFFAAFLAKEEISDASQVTDLLYKIANLDIALKSKLLDSFAKAKLPFADGAITESNLPKITASDLADSNVIQQSIDAVKNNQIDYKHATRFNDINAHSMQNGEVDLNILKNRYDVQLEEEYTYSQLKTAIIENPRFAIDTFKTEENIDLEIITAMFKVITVPEKFNQAKEILKILYNPTKTLSDQYLTIELNKFNLDEVLEQYPDITEQKNILAALSTISHEVLSNLILLLKKLPAEKLQSKDFTILKLIETAGAKIINNYFEAFKIVTEKFVDGDIGISLDKAYYLISKVAQAGYNRELIKQIVEYAIENKDYNIVTLLAKTVGRADNIAQVVEWICSFSADKIAVLNKTLNPNAKKWLTINQVSKIEIIGNIALKFEAKLTDAQYKAIITNITVNNLAHAKLIQSYLIDYSIDGLGFDEHIDLVIGNLATPEKLQTIFSEHNLSRFNYSKERVIDKISEIFSKNTEKNIPNDQQEKILEYFTHIFEKSYGYKELNINQIHDKAIELKHSRMLSKLADPAYIIDLDLDFLSLSFELLYRLTGKFPRDTQILSLLNGLLHQKSIIEEIATGQGKGITTALFAIYLWFTGQTVDVITSSQALAIRDLKEFSEVFDVLGIKHSKNIITASSSVGEYKKGGINYSTASDIALFRANREFYSNTHDVSLNADVSLVCDEVDSVLTSEINYKLAASMINANQAEVRSLFGYILEFTRTEIFKNDQLDRQDDIKNLELYLHYQLLKYDTSYKYPLNAIQINELKTSSNPLANKLYQLHTALLKADQNKQKLFDKLLDAVAIAESLENGIDYVLLKEDLDNKQDFLKATPIIKDQPSRGTSFGDGVQAFLHLLIEEAVPHLAGRFDISAPSSTIFNISPKNFFDHYRLTGGRIIGLTGTAGNAQEIEEFLAINKMASFNIPRFEKDLRDITQEVVLNKEEQITRTLDLVKSASGDRPIIIFSENTKAAEEIYAKVNGLREHVQLYAASLHDTDIIENIVNNAGNIGYITVTTPMLGRGADFLTKYFAGFLAINLCTHITLTTLWQIFGRIGRNGQEGEVISLFNKEIFGEDINRYMDSIALFEKEKRMESQALTDVLKFFSKVNHDNPINAIAYNEFIKNSWNNLLENNIEEKSYHDLRAELVAIVKTEYPLGSRELDDYLQRVDNDALVNNGFESYQVSYVIQQAKPKGITITEDNFQQAIRESYSLAKMARSQIIDQLQLPSPNSFAIASVDDDDIFKYVEFDKLPTTEYEQTKHNWYRSFYNQLLDRQNAVLATHIFSYKDNIYSISYGGCCRLTYNPQSIVDVSYGSLSTFYANNSQLYMHVKSGEPVLIDWLSVPIHQAIMYKIQNLNLKLNYIEEFAIISQAVVKGILVDEGSPLSVIEGEGSTGDLLRNKFKNSFNSYKARMNSFEVNKVSPLIDNFMNIKDLNLDLLEYGKYQAIAISTRMDSTSSHAESILLDGNLLFWINRGADTTHSGSGIKVFKIIKPIEEVKDILKQLQQKTLPQTETRSKIYTMLREDSDQDIPMHVLIKMQAQSIGNCGWTQTKGMLKAAVIVMKTGNITELPDIESQEWQKAIKDADDIYKDFVNYNIASQAEDVMFNNDPEFNPIFLDNSEQDKINARREFIDHFGANTKSTDPIKSIIEKLSYHFEEKADKFSDTIYESQIINIREQMELETILHSYEFLYIAVEQGKDATYAMLRSYQENKAHSFKQLASICNNHRKLCELMTKQLAATDYNIANIADFNEMLAEKSQKCSSDKDFIRCVELEVASEMNETCLGQGLTYQEMWGG